MPLTFKPFINLAEAIASLIEKMGDLTDKYLHALSFGTDEEAEEIIEQLAVVQKEYRRSLNDYIPY